ncbi:asparagine synthase (glutamine-hydrolyzing) [Chryseobacterium caseinilyticum]|uniref:asparagine synthase (glutamine-hydrolyzing) n=1 Tax=Chryseobacterium caseinilyticum TaxID=2771428 RepID=A0ABR8ZH38_9FLAO|nr:asparagine synthase (glutamine-hydrolyzing) [Chryseobacterium caseinilyticum]MBD8084616.1 asparagine synthase (glutamine-hydrolyzing) [Chryseobacterium caseinilyticum]
MCGITGFIDFTGKSSKETLDNMTGVIEHRGPDGQGLFFLEKEKVQIGFGHRRLSIIDLSHAADQPMTVGDLTIVFNGEIYNFQEIKDELLAKGRVFTTVSDTEVIVQSFQEWHTDAVQKFIGMFAFVIHNKSTDEFWLFRDRTGIKPLYYYQKNELILFASELKCFHKHPKFEKRMNIDSVSHFLQYGYISGDTSIFENVKKVSPGSFIYFNADNKTLKETKYWDAADFYKKNKLNIDFTEATHKTEEIIQSACEYRMVADVPVGVFLSGGYDSTLVTSLLQKNRTQKIKTFTIGVEDKNLNEALYAREIADRLGTDHTEMYCSESEMFDLIEKLPFHYDEPFGDSSAIPTMLVSSLARQHVTVALSADGGDEVFGGYNRYDYISKLNKIQKISKLPLPYNFLINKLISNHSDADRYKKIFNNPTAYQLADTLNTSYLKSDLLKLFKENISINEKSLISGLEIKGNLSKMMYYDYVTYLPDDILTKVDRATMAFSLEGREPMLDHRVLEWAATLPDSFKYNKGEKKYILKEIVHQYVPREMMNRPKMGFGVPVLSWLQNSLKAKLDFYLGTDFIKNQGIFNEIEINRLKENILSGKDRHYQKLWYILVFQQWYEKWMNQ